MVASASHDRRACFIESSDEDPIYFRAFLLISLILLLAVSCSSSVNAQNATSGGLTGVVTDPSGALMTEASVELKNNAKLIVQKITRRTLRVRREWNF
jgi:hypothetical protein